MKKIVLWICTVVMTLIASACIAGAYSPYFEAEPPREVREHTATVSYTHLTLPTTPYV